MGQAPRVFRVLLQVSDIDRARAFYEKLLGLTSEHVGGGRHYFSCGDVIVGLLDPVAGGEAARPMPDYLYFAVADLEALQAGARELGCLSTEKVHDASAGEVVTRPWGERSFYAHDPFGNPLCFVDERTLFTGRPRT